MTRNDAETRLTGNGSNGNDDAERRRALRRKLPFGRGAILEVGERTHIVGLADVSVTGAYLTTRAPLSVGDTYVLRLLMVPERIEMALRAEVVRVAQADHESTDHPRGVAVRFVDVEQTITLVDGSRAEADGEWVGVLGGLQITLDYRPEQHVPGLRMLRMQASLGVGPALGGDGGIMWQVRGGLTLQVTEQLGFMFGYRLLELDVENDDYALDGGLQGLFLAGSLRF